MAANLNPESSLPQDWDHLDSMERTDLLMGAINNLSAIMQKLNDENGRILIMLDRMNNPETKN